MRIVAVGLPLLATFLLGLVWLWENDLFLEFALVTAALGICAFISLRVPAWLQGLKQPEAQDTQNEYHIAENPDWSASERAAFNAARKLIDRSIVKPMAVEDMQPFALEVIRAVAHASGQSRKDELDFTIPEALLLVERVASRLRDDLKHHISIADRVSVGTLFWLWRNQERARKLYGVGHSAYRMFRLFGNLPTAVLREVGDAVTSGNSAMLTSELHATGQRILFEEVAKAATELYSGRLRMSDAELLESILKDADIDRARLASPDAPLRIAIAGQISAGKSSLANALLNRDSAETDMAPTTQSQTAYEVDILGMPCFIVDLPGLDGSEVASEATEEEALRCDMLLWALPVTRPGREIDRATIAAIRAHFSESPDRRIPPLIGVATFCDRLAGDTWPYPEHNLPAELQIKIGNAVRSIGQELTIETPVPVALGDNDWNMSAILQTIEKHFFEAVNVQRNRVRLTAGSKSISREAVDGLHGLGRGIWKIGKRAIGQYEPWKE